MADLVWSRLGNVDNFVEPFMGSAAVLLRRPAEHFRNGYRVETANDANHFIVNFWRAVAGDPEAVARHADRPVTEADLHAAHKWLMRSAESMEWRRRMAEDPFHFDAKIAGYWVHGQCCWIGGAWCNDVRTDYTQLPGINSDGKVYGVTPAGDAPTDWVQLPDIAQAGRGVHRGRDSSGKAKMPNLGQECSTGGIGVNGVGGPTDWVQPPDMTSGGVGIHAAAGGRPQLADAFDIGRGVNGNGRLHADGADNHKRVDLQHELGVGLISAPINPTAGICSARRAWLIDWMQRLADRLRLVRTCYGHWARVCDSESTLTRLGTTGVFLDPPYPARRSDTGEKSRDASLYATDKGADLDALRDEVLAWCVKWGGHKDIRVAVCGYEGDGYEKLVADHGWQEHAWEASGGYGNQSKGKKGKAENAKRERIWFSPSCVGQTRTLFDTAEDA